MRNRTKMDIFISKKHKRQSDETVYLMRDIAKINIYSRERQSNKAIYIIISENEAKIDYKSLHAKGYSMSQ